MDKNAEKKKLGVLELAGYGVGNCIGTGIFVSMGMGIGYTGRSIPLALLIANIVVLFAYSYHTVMGGMFALDGGKYAQAALLQPPLLTGFTAISNMLGGLGYAMFAMSLVEYAGVVFPAILSHSNLLSTVIVLLFFSVTIKGSKFMARLNMLMVATLTISLLVFIIAGVFKLQPGAFDLRAPDYFSGDVLGFVMAVAAMSFACQGATMPLAMTRDTQDPKRTLPKAILLASLIVTVFYVILGVVAAGVLPIQEVAGKNLGVVAREVFTYPVFVIFILGGACFAIATSLFGAIAGIQGPLMATIEDGWLPAFLGKKTKNGYPYVLMLVMLAIAILPIYFEVGVSELISCMLIPTMIVNIINNLLMIPLVRKYPTAWKNSFFFMPKPLFYAVVAVSVFCDLLITVASFYNVTASRQYLMAVVVVVLFVYSHIRLRSGKVNMRSVEAVRLEAEQNIRKDLEREV